MAVIQFPPLPALLFPSPAPKSRPPVLLPFWSTAPHAHIPRPRPSPGISHWKCSGPTQCRRLCSWHNSSDGRAFVQPRGDPRLAALSGPSRRGALCRPGPARPGPAGLGGDADLSSAVGEITRACYRSRCCEAVVLRACPSLTYDRS